MRQALHVGHAARRQGTGQDHDADIRHTQRRGTGVGGAGKGASDNTDGGNTAGFGRYSVVETPRCARASIGDPVDDGITRAHQGVNRLGSAGSAIGKLGGIDHLLDTIVALQDFL